MFASPQLPDEKQLPPSTRPPPRHHWRNPSRSVPRLREPTTNFDLAGRKLNTENNLTNFLAKLLNTNPHTIRAWRRGHRQTPVWALEILAEKLQAKIVELNETLTTIKLNISKQRESGR